ncbi:MAG: hypothetical protein IJX98_02445 [Clostridia bacterium]|nr:hypothetical protein [Clostridia bacterium]
MTKNQQKELVTLLVARFEGMLMFEVDEKVLAFYQKHFDQCSEIAALAERVRRGQRNSPEYATAVEQADRQLREAEGLYNRVAAQRQEMLQGLEELENRIAAFGDTDEVRHLAAKTEETLSILQEYYDRLEYFPLNPRYKVPGSTAYYSALNAIYSNMNRSGGLADFYLSGASSTTEYAEQRVNAGIPKYLPKDDYGNTREFYGEEIAKLEKKLGEKIDFSKIKNSFDQATSGVFVKNPFASFQLAEENFRGETGEKKPLPKGVKIILGIAGALLALYMLYCIIFIGR